MDALTPYLGPIYLLIASLLFALQFIFQKCYEQKAATGFRAGIWNQLFSSLSAAVILLFTTGLPTSMSPEATLLVVLSSLVSIVNLTTSILAMSYGPVGFVTSTCLVGGMALPFAFSVLFLKEAFTPAKAIGIALLILSVFLPMLLDRGGERDGAKSKLRYYLLCLIVALSNGGYSIISILHQKSAAPMTESGFILTSLLCRVLLSLVILLGIALYLKHKGERQVLKKAFWEVGNEKMTAKLFLFLILFAALFSVSNSVGNVFSLKCLNLMDASVQSPILTAVTIALGVLMGRIFFGEKITKATAISLAVSGIGILCFLI